MSQPLRDEPIQPDQITANVKTAHSIVSTGYYERELYETSLLFWS